MRTFINIILFCILSFCAAAQIPASLKQKFSIERQLTHDYFVFKQNGKSGLVNRAGTVLLPAVYNNVLYTRFNLFVAKKGAKVGIVNAKNKVVLPFEFDGIFTLSPERMHVSKDGLYFIVSSSNRFIADTTEMPDFIFQQAGGMFTPPRIIKDDEGSLDFEEYPERNHSITKEYQDLKPLTHDGRLYKFRNNELWGIVDSAGKELIMPTYENIESDIVTRLIIVTDKGKHSLLNSKLKPIPGGPFDIINPANEAGFSIVEIGDKPGLINSSGKIVIQPFNGYIREYGSYHFEMKRDTSWKVDIIDKNLKSILPPGTSSNGYIGNVINLVTRDGKMGLIHASGYVLLPAVYDEVSYNNTDGGTGYILKVRKGNNWYLADKEGKILGETTKP